MTPNPSNPTQTEDWVKRLNAEISAREMDLKRDRSRGYSGDPSFATVTVNLLDLKAAMLSAAPTQSPGMSELRGLLEKARELLSYANQDGVMEAVAQSNRNTAWHKLNDAITFALPTLLDDLAAAHARADRMEGALRELLDHPDCVARLSDLDRGIGTKTREAVFLRARSALTLKSEKAASSLKGSDVGEVGE